MRGGGGSERDPVGSAGARLAQSVLDVWVCSWRRDWTAGRVVENNSGLRGTILPMHQGHVQVQFRVEALNNLIAGGGNLDCIVPRARERPGGSQARFHATAANDTRATPHRGTSPITQTPGQVSQCQLTRALSVHVPWHTCTRTAFACLLRPPGPKNALETPLLYGHGCVKMSPKHHFAAHCSAGWVLCRCLLPVG